MATDKQRREADRRHLQRQAQRRRADEVRRRRANLIVSVVGVLVVVVGVIALLVATNGGGTSGGGGSDASPGSCKFPKSAAPAARKVTVPSADQPTKGTVDVSVQTSRGAMAFRLDRAAAPCTVGSFVSLVKQKFYDGTPCPRVESTSLFILQCGDPSGTGSGGPGYTIPDEFTGSEKYTKGSLAMANTGQPDSGGSQFFIIYKDDPLPAQYTIFGTVTRGLDIVAKVAAGGDDGSNQAGGGKPTLPIDLVKLSVAK